MKIFAVTVRSGRVDVEIDRYTVSFVVDRGPIGRVEMAEVSCCVLGRRSASVDRHDLAAQQARQVARHYLAMVIRRWFLEHPTERLETVDQAVLWLDPELPRLTNAERAANLAALDQLVSGLAEALKMPTRAVPRLS